MIIEKKKKENAKIVPDCLLLPSIKFINSSGDPERSRHPVK